ncbi:single-strand selective monofunctional uracil DNA glycosylase [Prorops nasuta]|uniref:single-strand selective monofunctional uracil DNA glycosylase n=1 Tax=Prorops nasuta TaxID=863751 RepID=UPI0034CD20BA
MSLEISENKSSTMDHQAEVLDLSKTSSYYNSLSSTSTFNVSEHILIIEFNLSEQLKKISFENPVFYVYNPLEYASEVHAKYVNKYCTTSKKILFLGMNPGPWGMSQTGVPFGEISMVRDWLKLSGVIQKPTNEHPERQITGFDCKRSEISGKRFWSLMQELYGIPENLFRFAYVHNYCPIALMDKSGRNITPPELKGNKQQKALYDFCDKALVDIIRLLNIEVIVGIGRFAEKRAEIVAKSNNLEIKTLYIPHPSPRAVGNQNWSDKAKYMLQEYGFLHLLVND